MGGVESVSRWGLWGACVNLERDCVVSKIEPVMVRVVLWWCGAGSSCWKCRKTLLFSTSLSSSVLIFFHSSPFLAHGLSGWPPLIIQPPPPPAGRLRGLLVAWFRRIIPVSAIAWKKDLKQHWLRCVEMVLLTQGVMLSALSRVRGRIKNWGSCFSCLCPNYHSAFPPAFSSRHKLALLHHLTTRSMQMPWLQHLHPLYKHWTAAVMLAILMMSLLGLSQWSIWWLEILFFTGTTSRLFHC